MSYQSLARKYRPLRFKDMVGQDAVTAALANAIKLGREPQGVVFSGVRGVGKTTAARLYAKALNCENGPAADPCNQCSSCLAVNDGNHEDVLEIDGASNTGVEDIRALQETLEYVPQRSKYKIYIIDEVHMLSQSAFNALLKTLEEPPAHVVFVFATTELHKVPETILSRCQVFHLKHLSSATTTQRIKEILSTEGIKFDEHALAAIAKEGRGSMRDALTFLDQVIALGDGHVAAEVVSGLVNSASSQSFVEFLAGMINKDKNQLLAIVEDWDQRGISFATVMEDVAKFSRHAFVMRELGRNSMDLSLLGLAPAEQDQLENVATQANTLDLNRIFRVIVRCRQDLDGSELDRFVVENCALEWCLDPGLPSIEELEGLMAGRKGTPHSAPGQDHKPVDGPQASSAKPAGNRSKLTDMWKANLGGQKSESQSAEKPSTNQDLAAPSVQKADGNEVQGQQPVPPSMANPKDAGDQYSAVARESRNEAAAARPIDQAIPEKLAPQSENLAAKFTKQDGAKLAPEPTSIVETQDVQPPNAPLQAPSTSLPNSWREIVEAWKKTKPLQGRMLEETVPLSFDEKLIRIAVDPKSMGGSKLLHADNKKKVCDGLRELFNFHGQLQVEVIADAGFDNPAQTQKESLLDTRRKEEEVVREKKREDLRNHPITVEALQVFDGTIKSIDLQEI